MKVMQSLFGAGGTGDPVDAALATAEVAEHAGPWHQITVMAVGGLTAIGFDRASDTLLVTSANGQSVIAGTTGDILYRNRDDDGLDVSALKGTRLDHPADERFDMAGLYGGGLRTVTDDGWSVEALRGASILHPLNASIHFLDPKWESYAKDPTFYMLDRGSEEIRALGFSWTGRTLAVATSSTLSLWARPAPLTL
ncbi:hypothetical protein L0664_02835 [Octadecabacter sp. G9-8]|uniref:Uncharacterized protein n=1 Tax=Octadecabacter dasysiphoniae TaxID=2909341 RepID=A0ABS9CT93_9RHOB|nr:hypothetical protein [Octadecabacter dasysiphoniae]MCF2869992.1 hypothetical protein [Octadecabacter dasysiphoniae]